HWGGPAGIDPEAPMLTLSLSDDVSLTAHFEETPAPSLLHYWHFNALPSGTLTTVLADYSVIGGAQITYPGTGAGYMDRVNEGTTLNARMSQPEGNALRVRNPSDTRELVLALPTTGYQDITLSYAAMRTTNGAQEQSLYYRIGEAEPWVLLEDARVITEEFQLLSFGLSGVSGVDDNPGLAIRILFGGDNASGTSGNNRFDNVVLEGLPLGGVNQPPQLLESIPFTEAIAGVPVPIDLSLHFDDPDEDVLIFDAVADRPVVVDPAVSGNVLTLTPLYPGDATITVTADDGHNPAVTTTFRILVYPEAHDLNASAFAFTAWNPMTPEHVYPAHMLFAQTDVTDPTLNTPLLFPYFIPHDDYHPDDSSSIGFPYNVTRRTRLNGLGADGISFINTGRDRDLGGAILAVNTQGTPRVSVAWLAATILQNERVYGLRLQYRLGATGDWTDVLRDGLPIEYVTGPDGQVQLMEGSLLPAEALGQPYVQLLWRYYHMAGDSGPRAELRLDEILVDTPPSPADLDGDGDVDLADFAEFQACLGQSVEGGCEGADFTGDGQITLEDYELFIADFTGP
ncbi:MAG: hypothetical protein JXB13_18415, partial [Phycisphaerae bacterium]|nr:hypothetical protein [Phycisphaerae bacterium]